MSLLDLFRRKPEPPPPPPPQQRIVPPSGQKAQPLKAEERSWGPTDDRWYSVEELLNATSSAGARVTPETALNFSAVYTAVKIITENVAMIPLPLYKRRPDGGKDRHTLHPYHRLLRLKPNRFMTGFQFREYLTGHVLLRGNGYAQKIYNRGNVVTELLVLHPSRVRVEVEDDLKVVYLYRRPDNREVKIPQREMFHLQGYTDHGIEGCSPITHMREAVGLGLTAQEFGSNLFARQAAPGGVLEHPKALSDEARRRLRQDFDNAYAGGHNAGKTMVLEEGMSWKAVGMAARDAEFLLTRRFQIEEIARIYRIPLYMLQDHTHSTFSNIEHLSLDFVTQCLMPWLRRWEETIQRDLFDSTDDVFAEFLVDGLLRGDIASRYAAYATGRQWGWLSVNDIRARENMNPVEGGDVYLQPMNMVDANAPAPDPQGGEGDQEPQDDPGDGEGEGEGERQAGVREGFRGAFLDVWTRVVRKELNAVGQAQKARNGDFPLWLAKFRAEHERFAFDCLKELYLTYQRTLSLMAAPEFDEGLALRELARIVSEYGEGIGEAGEERTRVAICIGSVLGGQQHG